MATRRRGDASQHSGLHNVGLDDAGNRLRILEYGQLVTFSEVTRYPESIGVTCHHAVSSHGFVIARDRNDIY